MLKRWWAISIPVRIRQRGLILGKDITFYGMPLIFLEPKTRVNIGDRIVLTSHSAFTALGVNRPCTVRTLQENAEITIGQDTGLSGTIICAAESISIGKECLIGSDVLITDTDFHPLTPTNRRFASIKKATTKSVVIGDNVFIGTKSIILKGGSIGSNSVIGAGSVVTSHIPENSIAAGIPARVVKKIR